MVSVRAPCRLGSARNEGRSTIVRSGANAREILARRADQQIADEQRVPGVFGEHARLDAQRRVGAAIEILREQRLAARVVEEVLEQRVEMLDRHRIVVFPPDDAGRSPRRARRTCPSGCGRCGCRYRRRADRVRRYALRALAERIHRAAVRRGSSSSPPGRESRNGQRRSRHYAPRSRSCLSVLPEGAPKWMARKSKQFHALRSTRRKSG